MVEEGGSDDNTLSLQRTLTPWEMTWFCISRICKGIKKRPPGHYLAVFLSVHGPSLFIYSPPRLQMRLAHRRLVVVILPFCHRIAPLFIPSHHLVSHFVKCSALTSDSIAGNRTNLRKSTRMYLFQYIAGKTWQSSASSNHARIWQNKKTNKKRAKLHAIMPSK